MKITHLVCAGVLLAAPLLSHSQSFKLKDIVKKGIAEGSAAAKPADAGKDNPASAVADTATPAGIANSAGIPKVMETYGIKLGDTRQQVEQILTSQGFKLGSTNNHLLGMNFLGVLWSQVYVKNGGKETGYATRDSVDVRFGPQSGRVLGIRRQERFDHPVVATEIRKALIEKYGTPSSQAFGEMNWVSYRQAAGGRSSDVEKCKAYGGVNLDGYRADTDFKECKLAVGVRLAGGGLEYSQIEVMVTDFVANEAEWAATHAMMKKKDAEVLEQHKKLPVPKL